MIDRDRRRELKRALGAMIDLAWRSDEYCAPGEPLTEEEAEYIQGMIHTIVGRLQ